MEQVLDIYERPYDPAYPVVCFDERPCQLLGDVLMPIPMKPGRVERQDYEYKRNGTCAILMAVEPLAGRRIATVSARRTKKDYAEFMMNLAKSYPDADKIVLVQDNLNTHNPSSFYETFPAAEAFALAQHFEMIYTPKKASWLNMAEIELSALSKQCLDRRIAVMPALAAEVNSWAKRLNRLGPSLQRNFILRSKLGTITRAHMSELGFLELETPYMVKYTPGGARNFLVPSRLHPGQFYALAESPQIFKQLFMVSGLHDLRPHADGAQGGTPDSRWAA